ncbi:hypothetical protein GCM10028824_37130 [Hymenobacter segetis]|uniref:DUF6799 domain-containing protein n=1 Tax=Hymenobacter segetis TaxID=2025509 RepID=A0ABU9LXJ1_9BACT
MKTLLKWLPALLLSGTCTLAQAQATPAAKPVAAKPMHKGKMAKECCMMKDGKMMMMEGGKMVPMTKDMTMANGTVCKPDGTCTLKDGTAMTMKEGQCMMMDGEMKAMDHMKHPGKMKPGHKASAMKM